MIRVTLIDNYDSFTWNLVHYLGALGARVTVRRNDAIGVEEALAGSDAIVLSPGPCTPKEAGVCLDLIRAAAASKPILGVCLGHQAIGEAYGGKVVRAPVPVHGKTSTIRHRGGAIFQGINESFEATRYHSLVVERSSLPEDLVITARTGEDGEDLVMGLSHKTRPVHGVQFHPESIMSEHGRQLLENFLVLARIWNETRRSERS